MTASRTHRPGATAWLMLVRCEAKMVMRDTAGLIVPVGLPLLILAMSASTASTETVVNERTVLEVFVLPLVIAIVVATIGLVNMPSFLAYYRLSGILRRLSVTPASPAMMLVGQVVVGAVQTLLGVGAALLAAFSFFGARPPVDPFAAVGVFALVMGAMYAVGMIVAAIAPTPNAAVAIGLVVFFALGACGGLFGSPDALPDPVAQVGGWLPFGASVEALSAAWAGTAIAPANLIGLAAAIGVGAAVAATVFRWDRS
ncbi:ABC transporter permease [Rhodococcus rhodochrous]|uniref:ABC transporter permease n=1 Tax=Rhodococcus rhodochrous TaxID=1829 RepID=UPI00132F2987|nr:ABC transporter permease [Rhodococcus rhodochrous]QHG83281.1 ABC transporter permease [Rhodococcus rhodochrous]QOH57038.1 ABC transporter permease [Rhodococcus rhodochrous]